MPEHDPVIKLSDIEKWIEHCKNDTISATPYQDEYIIDHGSYGEMVSDKQLRDRGYKYSNRWNVGHGTSPEYEYYFIKDPNDPVGFVKWKKEQK